MTVVPAYGRDYASADDARADWLAGKDFLVADIFSPWDGKPTGKDDHPAGMITIRFDSLRETTRV